MDLELILRLIQDRRNAFDAYKLAQAEFLANKDRESFSNLQATQQHYLSFQRCIYSFENMTEMFALLQENEDMGLVLSHDETHKLTLNKSKTDFPMLKLETKEEIKL